MTSLSFLFRLTDVLDKFDEGDAPSTSVNVFMHPPGDGSTSDGESGDEENAYVNRLLRSLILTSVEIDDQGDTEGETENVPPPKKRKVTKKPTCSWLKQEMNEIDTSFEVVCGLSELSVENDEPVTYFRLLWDNDVRDFIMRETMAYSGESITVSELDAIYGVLAASGVVGQTRRRDYWSSKKLKNNQAISNSISVNRFEKIFSSLHFVPLGSNSNNDRFQKVRILFSILNRRFMKYAPNGNAYSVDESMIPYYGRHGCK